MTAADQVETMCQDGKYRTLEQCRGIARSIGVHLEAAAREAKRLPGQYAVLHEPSADTVAWLIRQLERDFA